MLFLQVTKCRRQTELSQGFHELADSYFPWYTDHKWKRHSSFPHLAEPADRRLGIKTCLANHERRNFLLASKGFEQYLARNEGMTLRIGRDADICKGVLSSGKIG